MNLLKQIVVIAISAGVLASATLASAQENEPDKPIPMSAGELGIKKTQLRLLLGIDADQNGIRDDVDAFIAKTYPGDDGLTTVAMIVAAATQKSLKVTSAVEVKSAVQADVYAVSCANEFFGERWDKAMELVAIVKGQVLNTAERTSRAVRVINSIATPESVGSTFCKPAERHNQ